MPAVPRFRQWCEVCYGLEVDLAFVQLSEFVASWKRHKLSDEDLQALEAELLADPEAGAVMVGTGGLRKMRFAPPSRHGGKRGGFRVGYAYFVVASTIYLFVVFPKGERANLTAAEKAAVRKALTLLRQRNG